MNELEAEDSPETEANTEQEHTALLKALDQLDPLDAQIMRELHGIGCEESTEVQIAIRHNVTQPAIANRKKKILRILRDSLRRSGDIQGTTVQTVSPAQGSWRKKTGFWEGRSERDQAKGAPIAPTEGTTNFPVDQMTDDPVRRSRKGSLWAATSWAWKPLPHESADRSRGELKMRAFRARG